MKLSASIARALVWVAGVGLVLLSSSSSVYVAAKAILGVDLGSLYMKVALVQRGAPLEIVTNMHSKRKTEQMILFDQGARFYGADASSLLARKPTQTPVAMSIMLGRDEDHPAVKVRVFCRSLTTYIELDMLSRASSCVCIPILFRLL
jgi:hypoxia up-regulated 1